MNSDEAYNLTLQTGISNATLEEIIIKNYACSMGYAKYVLRGRFELVESVMSKDALFAWMYAITVLKGWFRLGEEIIFKNTWPKDRSCDYLINAMGYNHE